MEAGAEAFVNVKTLEAPSDMKIRPFEDADEEAVVALWESSGLLSPWNDPRKDIARKRKVQRDLFLVGTIDGNVVATVMGGYDGHRGWINFLAVDPDRRLRGLGREMMDDVRRRLEGLGCSKINLQIRRDNPGARAFYVRLGYVEDSVVSLGIRLEDDGGV